MSSIMCGIQTIDRTGTELGVPGLPAVFRKTWMFALNLGGVWFLMVVKF